MNIHRESVVDGNQTLVLGLIWAIIHHYQVRCTIFTLCFKICENVPWFSVLNGMVVGKITM